MIENSFRRVWVLVFPLISFSSLAWAQEPIPFLPSPMVIVDRMLELAEVKQSDLIYDLGSGDGRILIRAAKKYGARGVGIDIDPDLVALARKRAAEESVSHLVEFRAEDALEADISEATVVALYMFEWFNNAMRPKLQRLKPGSRIVAHDYGIDDWPPTKVVHITLYPEDSATDPEDRDAMEWRRSKRNRALVTLAAFVVGAIIVATFWALQWASTGHLPVWWRSL